MKKTKKVAMNETAKVTAPKVEKVPEKKPAAKEAVAAPAKKEEVKEIVQHTEEVKETVKSFEKVLTDMGAKILNSKDLGQKKLAYEIKKQVRGYYHLLNVECESAAVKEFDRKALIDEKILRHLIIKEEE